MMNFLVPVDFSESTDRVLQVAVKIAKPMDAKIHLVHVVESVLDAAGWKMLPDMQTEMAAQFPKEYRELVSLTEDLHAAGCLSDALLLQGPIVPVILYEIERQKINMVVMGSHGHGALYDIMLGSICDGVMRQACCPVTVVPSRCHDVELNDTVSPASESQ